MKPIIVVISICLLTLTSYVPVDTNERASRYINQYKHLAISEMQRTGIPASIKLAQGLLESGWGESKLAVHANNHFGIKCGGSWNGGTYYIEDDDYVDGKKIKSCFRSFASAHESYIAHSEFLSNPKKERYALLFYFPQTDYKAWAYGLKDAGYATDPKYPQKLISLIETYELNQYDGDGEIIAYGTDNTDMPDYSYLGDDDSSSDVVVNQQVDKTSHKTVMIPEQRGAQPSSSHSNSRSTTESRRSTTESRRTTTASRTKKSNKNLIGKFFNNDRDQNNRDRDLRDAEYHIVAEGEKMRDLARQYGIPSALLYSKNRMPLGTQPLAGEKIQLKGTVRIGERPKFDYPQRAGSLNEFVFGTSH